MMMNPRAYREPHFQISPPRKASSPKRKIPVTRSKTRKELKSKKGHSGAQPELPPEHLSPWQAVVRNGPGFNSCHDPACQQEDEEFQDLIEQVNSGGAAFLGQQTDQRGPRYPEACDNDCKRSQSPACADPGRPIKKRAEAVTRAAFYRRNCRLVDHFCYWRPRRWRPHRVMRD